jgi:prepilin-type N-terminal cleavage/methylation domain-containing protein
MIQRVFDNPPALLCNPRNMGFSLVEVLVSITIIATFMAVALQGMGIAAMLSARAVQSTEAANWIQADLEKLRLHTTATKLTFNPAFCRPDHAHQGFAAALQQHLERESPSITEQSSTGQKFNLGRVLQIDPNQPPYKVLGINYEVTPQAGGKSILSFYTEVIPDAAFTCE